MLRTFRRKAWANLAGVAGVAGGLLMCLAGSVYGTLAAEDQQPGTPSKPVLVPPPAPPEPSQTAPQPDYAPFPGIWFDYLPDVVSADNGWEMQFRVGLAGQTAVQAQFLDADRKPLKTVTLPDPTTPDDFAHGKLSVLTLAVPADLHAAFVRLIAQSSVQNGVQPAGVQVEIELRSAANADAGVDLRLASLPPRARAGSAENLVAEAQAPGSGMRGLTWGCLGARLCAADGHPVVLSVHPRAPQVDRSGLVTGVFRPPAPPDPNAPARRTLIVAPAVLGPTLAAALNIAQVQAIPVRHLGGRAGSGTSSVAPSSSPAASSGPAAAPANSSVTRLVLAPQATRDEPFHPMAGCLAAALAAIDRPDNADLERLVVILPWDDALFGTDPREFSLALDALSAHWRARRQAGAGDLRSLIVIGPFRHPSVPEKRHTMLVSTVTERQRAQGFQWPDLPVLDDPADWRLNSTDAAVAVYGSRPNSQGCQILGQRIKEILAAP